jgi:hypothetical protein
MMVRVGRGALAGREIEDFCAMIEASLKAEPPKSSRSAKKGSVPKAPTLFDPPDR